MNDENGLPDKNKLGQKNSLQNTTYFEFPCKFPIKIMANQEKKMVDFVLNTLEKYVLNAEQIKFKTRKSKTGKYISITATFEAISKEQLDNIYQALSKHPDIHMVL